MTSLAAAPGVLGWGEPAVAQAKAAARVARREWALPVDAPAPAGYADLRPVIAHGASPVSNARTLGIVVVPPAGQEEPFGEHPGMLGGSAGKCPADGSGQGRGSAGLVGVAGEWFGDGLGESRPLWWR